MGIRCGLAVLVELLRGRPGPRFNVPVDEEVVWLTGWLSLRGRPRRFFALSTEDWTSCSTLTGFLRGRPRFLGIGISMDGWARSASAAETLREDSRVLFVCICTPGVEADKTGMSGCVKAAILSAFESRRVAPPADRSKPLKLCVGLVWAGVATLGGRPRPRRGTAGAEIGTLVVGRPRGRLGSAAVTPSLRGRPGARLISTDKEAFLGGRPTGRGAVLGGLPGSRLPSRCSEVRRFGGRPRFAGSLSRLVGSFTL